MFISTLFSYSIVTSTALARSVFPLSYRSTAFSARFLTGCFLTNAFDYDRPYLLPPTPSSGPGSPALSDQESIGEDEIASDKGDAVQDEKEEIKKG